MLFTFFVALFLSFFSTTVMSYISMATPIGPWIATTLVLIAMLLFKLFAYKTAYVQKLALVTSAGSIGGILSTAAAFSFPTLYFLDPILFDSWMADPIYFSSVLTGLALSAGWFGLWIANVLEDKFIFQEKLAFPIGQLTYKMINAQNQVKKAYELVIGFVGTGIFCFLQDGLFSFKGFIPRAVTLIPNLVFGQINIPPIPFDLWPMVWAIGFVTGHVIAIPLAVGALTNIFVINPLNHLFFNDISKIEFILAFCSGMIVSGTLISFLRTPKVLWYSVGRYIRKSFNHFDRSLGTHSQSRMGLVELCAVLFLSICFLSYFDFSLLAQLYLFIFTFACTHEIISQAGEIGLARLGAFATFVMVPAMLIFNLNFIQVVLVAAFVEICGGVAVDILFGRKLAQLSNISSREIKLYQYLGLAVSSLSIGVVFWLYINHFGLGSPELFALKAKNRELLINARNFNYYILFIGFLFGFILKKVRVNPSLVLGGILMPINISLGLIFGGLCTKLTKNREEWYPFWSGVFASNSVWMLIKAVI